MDGIPALTHWDLVIEKIHSAPIKIEPGRPVSGNQALIQCKHTNVIPTKIDHIPSNTVHSGAGAMLYVFEDNEEVIKMSKVEVPQ